MRRWKRLRRNLLLSLSLACRKMCYKFIQYIIITKFLFRFNYTFSYNLFFINQSAFLWIWFHFVDINFLLLILRRMWISSYLMLSSNQLILARYSMSCSLLELFQKFHFPGFFPCFLYLINNYFLLFFNAISGKPSNTSNTISCKYFFLFYGQYEYLELSPNVEMNLVLFVYLMYRIGTIVLFFYVVQLFNQINIWNVVWSFMLCNWTQWQTRDFIRLF